MKCTKCSSGFRHDPESYLDCAEKVLMVKQHICFTCAFWLGYIQRRDEPGMARIKGVHYVVGDEKASWVVRGFDGQRFVIRFKDGRVVTTHNLWHQGEIPEVWKSELPDNAEFVRPELN
jgi:hypothetical protein